MNYKTQKLFYDYKVQEETRGYIFNRELEFWRVAYNNLLEFQKAINIDNTVSAEQAVVNLKHGIKKIAKENSYKYAEFSTRQSSYISVNPIGIFVRIENKSKDFSIVIPHLYKKCFAYSEWKRGISWIQDSIAHEKMFKHEKYYRIQRNYKLNEKAAKIAKTSIAILCNSILPKKSLKYKLVQYTLKSDIFLKPSDNKVYRITVYHKPFSKKPGALTKLLNDPMEIKNINKFNCGIIATKEN